MTYHFSVPTYAEGGQVFVWANRILKKRAAYVCLTMHEAERDKRPIITCRYCDEPAVRLDHSFPYMNGLTVCAYHLTAPRGGWRDGPAGYAHYFRDNHSLCRRWEIDGLIFEDRAEQSHCKTCERKLSHGLLVKGLG